MNKSKNSYSHPDSDMCINDGRLLSVSVNEHYDRDQPML